MQVVGSYLRPQAIPSGLALLAYCSLIAVAAGADVDISAEFPGGNVKVTGQEGNTVFIEPDLRGGRSWFYWHFEAKASQPGRVTFVFPAEAGAQIGMNGPAVSMDGGKTWRWLGVEDVRYQAVGRDGNNAKSDAFSYHFSAANQAVRFSVGIPYLQHHLDQFIARLGDNPHLLRGVLTRSRHGRPVAIWQIGKEGPDVTPVLVSARHHACEALASYVLEGFLEEALSDSPSAVTFRQRYVVYAVPIVDVDGVEQGDQGKWRSPHDHNRDYGQQQMLYPPVISMVELAKAKKIELALDFHCPTLRMDIHQGFYFAGIRLPHIKNNMDELIGWMNEERPPAVTYAERDLLSAPEASPPTGGMPFSNYFAYQPGVKFAATLECPYTQRGNGLEETLARAYGQGLLRAWAKTEFVSAKPDSARDEWGVARFQTFRKSFLDSYKSQASDAENIARRMLNHSQAPRHFQLEAHRLLGTLRFHQRNYPEAIKHLELVRQEELASANQRASAAAEIVRVVSAWPQASMNDLAIATEAFAEIRHASPQQQAAAHEAAAAAYSKGGEFEKALAHAQRWSRFAGRYKRGEAFLAVANLYERLGDSDKAIQTRQEAVAILRKELDPVPVGVFGPMMAADLLDALNGIPTATAEEKQAAANIALNHQVKPASIIRRIQEGLKKNE